MGKVYGYARCSTDESRQNINRQYRDLKAMGVKDRRYIYWEYESGAKTQRPELEKLLSIVEAGDTIAATEVSRLTRSTKQLCDLVEMVKEKRLRLVIGSLVLDCREDMPDSMTAAMLQIMGVFAELERQMISDRVKSGLANAKANGKRLGQKPLSKETIPAAFWKHYPAHKAGQLSVMELAALCGVHRTTIYRYVRFAQNIGDK